MYCLLFFFYKLITVELSPKSREIFLFVKRFFIHYGLIPYDLTVVMIFSHTVENMISLFHYKLFFFFFLVYSVSIQCLSEMIQVVFLGRIILVWGES